MTTYERLLADEITVIEACNLLADQIEREEAEEAARMAKVEELDSRIESLHQQLDSYPNRRWDDKDVRFRLGLLIDCTARRHLLSL